MPNVGLEEVAILAVALAPLIILAVVVLMIASGMRSTSRRRGEQLDRIERRLVELEERIKARPDDPLHD